MKEQTVRTCHIKTFGCQMNVHDSERIAGILEGEGYIQVPEVEEADLVVINTCSIREKADQKFFSELGRLKKVKEVRPGMKIAAAGCIAQQQGSRIRARFPHVDIVFGPQNIARLPEMLNAGLRGVVAVDENPEFHILKSPAKRNERFRAWVPIMYGCDNFCTYCIVPYTRGREKSRPMEAIVEEAQRLSDEGCIEVTLLGQNVNSYGKGLESGSTFPNLLRRIAQVQGLRRIRFVTSHPKDLSEELIACFRDLPTLCSHIHLPLQSGSDAILERMNRKYTLADYMRKVELLRIARPDISITTDLIVGFPGETDRHFQETLNAIRQIEYAGVFAFQYSERPGTQAINLDGKVSAGVKADRLDQVLKLQDSICEKLNRESVGQILEVLIEESVGEGEERNLTGRTFRNNIVHFKGGASRKVGELVNVVITEGYAHSLKAILL